jgi:hypothetical protein
MRRERQQETGNRNFGTGNRDRSEPPIGSLSPVPCSRFPVSCLFFLLLGGCGGEEGTITIELVTAPGSDLLERIQRARLTLSNPEQVVEAERDEDGELSLSLEVVAEGQSGAITLEGFDAAGDRIALGLSPALPVAAVDASTVIYLAPPRSIAEAPVALDPARSAMGGALLPYGAVLAGGTGADGDPLADLVIYNAYDHILQIGLDLPAPRAEPSVLTGPSDFVYLFGGIDEDDQPSADAWRFDTSVAPAGVYLELVSSSALARAGAGGAWAGNETFFLAGDPAARIDALGVTALDGAIPTAGGEAVTIASSVPTPPVLVLGLGVGTSGAAIYQGGALDQIEAPPEALRVGHALLALPGGDLLAVGGEDAEGVLLRSALVFDPSGQFSVLDDFLATGRRGAAIAVTADVVIVAGGSDAAGVPLADAELFDAETLEPIATIPLGSERIGGLALRLPNRQVLLAGGTTGAGEPLALLELFTPDN